METKKEKKNGIIEEYKPERIPELEAKEIELTTCLRCKKLGYSLRSLERFDTDKDGFYKIRYTHPKGKIIQRDAQTNKIIKTIPFNEETHTVGTAIGMDKAFGISIDQLESLAPALVTHSQTQTQTTTKPIRKEKKKKGLTLLSTKKDKPTRKEYLAVMDNCITHVASGVDLFNQVQEMGKQLGYTEPQIGKDFNVRAKALHISQRTIQRILPPAYKGKPRGSTTPKNIILKAKQKEISANLAQNQEQDQKLKPSMPDEQQSKIDEVASIEVPKSESEVKVQTQTQTELEKSITTKDQIINKINWDPKNPIINQIRVIESSKFTEEEHRIILLEAIRKLIVVNRDLEDMKKHYHRISEQLKEVSKRFKICGSCYKQKGTIKFSGDLICDGCHKRMMEANMKSNALVNTNVARFYRHKAEEQKEKDQK